MKKLYFLLALLLLFNSKIISQWQQQLTNLPSLHNINYIDAVDDNICWATAYKFPGISAWLGYIRTTDGGSTWVCDTIQNVTGIFKTICAIDANAAFVSIKNTGQVGRIFKTTDGGNSWQQLSVAFTLLNDAPKFIHFFDSNNGIAIGDRQGNYFEIFTTSDGGSNWVKVPENNLPSSITNEVLFGDDYTASGNSIWFLTSESRIFRSTDKGLTWNVYNSPQFFSGGDPNIEFKDELNGILITNSNSLWKTSDGGNSLSSIFYNGHITPRYISFVPGSVATYVFTSQNGSNYTYEDGNIFVPIDSVSHYYIDFASPTAGWTSGNTSGTIYRWAGNFVSVDENILVAKEFHLYQNYPNPFNPGTKIRYTIPTSPASLPLLTKEGIEGRFVTLKVYDLLGREVATLVNEYKPAGTYAVEFDVTHESIRAMASGIYFYQLKVADPSTGSGESFVQTKKMTLIK